MSCASGVEVPLQINISGPFGAPTAAYAPPAAPPKPNASHFNASHFNASHFNASHFNASHFTLRCSYQQYDYLIGIGGGIGFTPFMSILKDFLREKRARRLLSSPAQADAGSSESRNNVALFYGVCKSFDDVAWWSSLTCEPDFSSFVSSCSAVIDRQQVAAAQSTTPALSLVIPSQELGQDVSEGRLAVTLFCTGASAEKLVTAQAMAPPGVAVRPGRPHFDGIFK
jgi:hypothetical protein